MRYTRRQHLSELNHPEMSIDGMTLMSTLQILAALSADTAVDAHLVEADDEHGTIEVYTLQLSEGTIHTVRQREDGLGSPGETRKT